MRVCGAWVFVSGWTHAYTLQTTLKPDLHLITELSLEGQLVVVPLQQRHGRVDAYFELRRHIDQYILSSAFVKVSHEKSGKVPRQKRDPNKQPFNRSINQRLQQ